MRSRRTPKTHSVTRRQFLKSSAAATAALLGPAIVPASVFGADAPSNRITFGFIGVGRMGTGDMREILGLKQAQVVAVCDVDSNRVKIAQESVETHYARQRSAGTYRGCRTFAPAEIGHRSCTVCLLGDIAMRLGRKLRWDPEAEKFANDDEANRMLSRPMRSPWRL